MTEAAFRARQRIEANDSGTDHADGVYDAFRDDALTWLSKAAPQDRSASLSIASGTLSYAEPSGFLTMTSAEDTFSRGLSVPKYRIETATYAMLRPDLDFVVYGSNIVLSSDPLVTATWTIYYGGTYVITELPDEWIPIVLDFATARIFDLKATTAASFFDYSVGGDSVSKGSQSSRWIALRDERMARATARLSEIAVSGSPYGSIRLDRA